MIKNSRIIIFIFFLLILIIFSISFLFKKELVSSFKTLNFFIAKNISINSDKYIINTVLYDLKIIKKSTKNVLKKYNYKKINSPVGFLESYNNRLFLVSNKGELFEIEDFNNFKFKKINTNFTNLTANENFIRTMGVRGIYFDNINKNIFISYIYNEAKNNCTGISLISGKMNDFKNILFKKIFKTSCIKYSNLDDFNEMSSGGKIISLDSKNLLLTVGDFWQNNISQDPKKEYGKVLIINKQNFNYDIFSTGHRNQQGITKINDKIFASEHGPRGGDEINVIVEGKNYGWPIVSYGPSYSKDYNKYYLKDHKFFQEPLYVFAPSIGISDIEFYNSDLLRKWKGDLLVASMKNNTGMISLLNPGLSLYRIKLNKSHTKVIYSEKIYIGDRIRDIEIFDNGEVFFITEEDPSIYKINKLQ